MRSLAGASSRTHTPAGYFVYLPAEHFPPTYEAHWDTFWWWCCCAILTCAAVTVLARILLPLLLPRSWAAMVEESPWKATSVPKNVTEWWPAIVVAPLAWDSVSTLTRAALAEHV